MALRSAYTSHWKVPSQLPHSDASAGVRMGSQSARQVCMTLAQILTLARERIRSGQLPPSLPSNIWAGHGNGHRCAVCDEVISSAERQYEFAVATPGGHSDYRLHFSCHQAWIG